MADQTEFWFIGPDDSETCNGCADAVANNPYTEDDVPEPGEFECMSRCRHMVQMQGDAPDDMPSMEWNSELGFADSTDNTDSADVADARDYATISDTGSGDAPGTYGDQSEAPAQINADGTITKTDANGDEQQVSSDNMDDPEYVAELVLNEGISIAELIDLGLITAAVAAEVSRIVGDQATPLTYDDVINILNGGDVDILANLLQNTPDMYDEAVQLGRDGLDDGQNAYDLKDALNASADNNGDAASFDVYLNDVGDTWYVVSNIADLPEDVTPPTDEAG